MRSRVASLISILTVTSSVVLLGQSPGANAITTELRQLHDRWFVAFDKGDGATMDTLEVPNLVLVNADGTGAIWQKRAPRAGTQKPTGIDSRTLTDARVRQFGDTAIMTGRVTAKRGSDQSQVATTVVFVRQNGRWLIASAQWSDVNAATR